METKFLETSVEKLMKRKASYDKKCLRTTLLTSQDELSADIFVTEIEAKRAKNESKNHDFPEIGCPQKLFDVIVRNVYTDKIRQLKLININKKERILSVGTFRAITSHKNTADKFHSVISLAGPRLSDHAASNVHRTH